MPKYAFHFVWYIVAPTFAGAQLNILTTREAQELVELIPAVSAAQSRGECPQLTIHYEESSIVGIQVRGACPKAGFNSSLIDNYVVDRRTGIVTEQDQPADISTPAMKMRATRLLLHARERLLTFQEARCLARETVGNINSNTGKSVVTVSPVSTHLPEQLQFTVEHRLGTFPAVAVRFVTVDLTTGHVRDDATGGEIISANLAHLLSMMYSARSLPTLSPEQILEVAIHIAGVRSELAAGCAEVDFAGYGTSEEAHVSIRGTCPGALKQIPLAASINITTGAVTQAHGSNQADILQAESLARELLRSNIERIADTKEVLASNCGPM